MQRLVARTLASLGRRAGFSRPAEPLVPHHNNPAVPKPRNGPSTAEISRRSIGPFAAPISLFHHKLGLQRRWVVAGCARLRWFSSINEGDEISIEEEAERKVGWLLKLIFVGTAALVAFQFFPYMGDNLLRQSISLLHVKDPLFKRMGASRLSRYAVDDERRMKVVEMGGAQELLNVLEAAKDDKTRKQALKALVALSHSDAAAKALHHAGAVPIITSSPNSPEYAEVEMYKSNLLKRFEEMKPQLDVEVN